MLKFFAAFIYFVGIGVCYATPVEVKCKAERAEPQITNIHISSLEES